ncbi:MAG: hypothetical protein PVJ39_01410 [Gammaproteobacteria bacterium]|jgi:hypothetical protein
MPRRKSGSVCVRCGAFKNSAFSRCKQCEFQPETDYEAARSLILSETRVIGDIEVGHTPEELQDIAAAIRRGRPFPIDGELQKQVVRAYYKHLKANPPSKWPLRRVLKWAAVVIINVAMAAVIIGWFWIRKS